jgi:hypothetical protein
MEPLICYMKQTRKVNRNNKILCDIHFRNRTALDRFNLVIMMTRQQKYNCNLNAYSFFFFRIITV